MSKLLRKSLLNPRLSAAVRAGNSFSRKPLATSCAGVYFRGPSSGEQSRPILIYKDVVKRCCCSLGNNIECTGQKRNDKVSDERNQSTVF